jgi:hypothetical protein
MKCPSLFVLLVSSLLPLAAADPIKRDFEADAVGQRPAGFEIARTGGGAEGKWVVRTEKGAAKNHVLAQEDADTTDNRFPVALLKDRTYKDVALSVRARPLSGHVDQGFGLVWRYRDASNYYVTRCNALEDNCRVYHVVNGSRRQFGTQDLKVATNAWHTVKVQAAGNHFVVFMDGNRIFDGTDDTFKEAGKVGLWTKADSVIEFDDFTAEGRD